MQDLLAHPLPNNTFLKISLQRKAGKSRSDEETASPGFKTSDAFSWSRATTAEASPEVSEADSPSQSDEHSLVMDNAPSIGSMVHHLGRCNPCAWYWKPQGCTKGSYCTRCHLCPDGELKARKKAKKVALQAARGDGGSELQAAAPQHEPISLASSLSLEDEQGVNANASELDMVFAAEELVHGTTPRNPYIQFEMDDCGDLPGRTPSGNLPVKNTFIQFDIDEDDDSRDRDAPPHHSAPGQLQGGASFFPRIVKRTQQRAVSPEVEADREVLSNKLSETSSSTTPENKPSTLENGKSAREEMELLHMVGECTPCAYFWYKKDGCRQGSDCAFCHLCPKGEIKKRKKDKIRSLKAEGVFRVS